MLCRQASRTVGRRSERTNHDPFAVPATAEHRVAQASGLCSVLALCEYPPGSGLATSFVLPGSPPLMEALLCRTRKSPLAGPILQRTHWRDKWRHLRVDGFFQKVNLRVRHHPREHAECQSFQPSRALPTFGLYYFGAQFQQEL